MSYIEKHNLGVLSADVSPSCYLVHCKYLNARFECNDIVISVYSHYPFDQNAKSSDTKCFTLSIKCFRILIERVMTVYGNYNVIAFKSCIQIFTVLLQGNTVIIAGKPHFITGFSCTPPALPCLVYIYHYDLLLI